MEFRFHHGRTEIKATVFVYLFDKYGEHYEDAEREEWGARLNFLGVKATSGNPDISSIFHAFVEMIAILNKSTSSDDPNRCLLVVCG
ncbi:hypothetical protein [Paenibacillus daejeonensis]|uniref:hypothetical protein n=1 Tax=Paenibacillus daejeonensis TaxID=135193 RepID=UPI0003A760ED|nr:hypothetical protein [Paenibacillus daejeonensis]